MKVLFLDVDGVLNSVAWWESITDRKEKDARWANMDHFDPVAVERVNRLLTESGAKVVISSTWRHLMEWGDLLETLSRNGLKADIIGKTCRPKFSYRPRGHEIQEWLNERRVTLGVTNIVILDDEEDMAHLDPWLVRTTWAEGIQDGHVETALEILEKPMPV